MALKTNLEPFKEPLKVPHVGQPKDPVFLRVYKVAFKKMVHSNISTQFFEQSRLWTAHYFFSWTSIEIYYVRICYSCDSVYSQFIW